jgi:hypothetical protein
MQGERLVQLAASDAVISSFTPPRCANPGELAHGRRVASATAG